MQIVLDFPLLRFLPSFKSSVSTKNLGFELATLIWPFAPWSVGIPLLFGSKSLSPRLRRSFPWGFFQVLGQLGMEAKQSQRRPTPSWHPAALHPNEAHASQLLSLDGRLPFPSGGRRGLPSERLFCLRILPLLPPSMDGLSAEGILHDDDLVFAQGLFDRGAKGFQG